MGQLPPKGQLTQRAIIRVIVNVNKRLSFLPFLLCVYVTLAGPAMPVHPLDFEKVWTFQSPPPSLSKLRGTTVDQ